jgi:hypothetical protein
MKQVREESGWRRSKLVEEERIWELPDRSEVL